MSRWVLLAGTEAFMNVKLTPNAAELLEAVRTHRQEPIERILEHAFEVFAREEHIGSRVKASGDSTLACLRHAQFRQAKPCSP